MMLTNLPLVVILFISLLLAPSCHSPSGKLADGYFRVTRVVDGDTFWIDDGTEKGKKVRLIGVDAPETRRTSRKELGFYGRESKEYLTELLLDQEIRLEYDVDKKDRYGRTLAYVYLRDGTHVNAELLRKGYAMVLTVPPNVKFAEDFVRLQQSARRKELGLWKVKGHTTIR